MAPSRVFTVWALGRAVAEASTAPPGFGYDPAEASQFAAVSATTYCGPEQISEWYCGPCQDSGIDLVPGTIQILHAEANNATMAVVAKFGDQRGCLVAFRGSANVRNWVQDFHFFLIDPAFGDCDGCRVERGFYTAWTGLRAPILQALGEIGCVLGTEDALVRVTGHSLGGSLAHLAMFDLERAGYRVAKSFSFEAARVGNAAFSEKFSTKKLPLFRITHFMDPVPHVPPRFMGFTHVQTEVYYHKSGRYTICPEVEDRSCSERFGDNIPRLLMHVGDHCASPVVPGGYFCGQGLSCNAEVVHV